MRQSDDRGNGGPGGSGDEPQDLNGPSVREPIFNMPPVVSWTVGVLVVLYVVFQILDEATQLQILLDYAFIPARFTGLPPEFAAFTFDSPSWAILTMVSHTGLHGGTTHIVFNVLWLMAFATPVARAVGTVRYLALFVISAIAGAGVFWLAAPESAVPAIGASGAVSGMMGAALRYMFGRAGRETGDIHRLAPLTDSRLLMFTGAWLVINLIFGLVGFGTGGDSVQIAWQAHVGGFMAGLLFIPLLDRR